MNNNRIYYSKEAEEQARRGRTILTVATAGVSLALGVLLTLLLSNRRSVDLRSVVDEGLKSAREVGERIIGS